MSSPVTGVARAGHAPYLTSDLLEGDDLELSRQRQLCSPSCAQNRGLTLQINEQGKVYFPPDIAQICVLLA